VGNTGQRDADDKPTLAFSTAKSFGAGDRLILVLRSITWSEAAVEDIVSTLDGIGLKGRYAVIYLDDVDEAHIVRASSG
jgi:hypothetical protein